MNEKPKYNPLIHQRRSIMLTGYDYSRDGLYFVTICCHAMESRFGKIENYEMFLNECGVIAFNEWVKMPERFKNIEPDVFQIMPNHMHAIVSLNSVGAALAAAPDANAPNADLPGTAAPDQSLIANPGQPHEPGQPQGLPVQPHPSPTLGDIIGAYKSLVANACLELFKSRNESMGKLWHRNYHEHIIRNERSYQIISEYIINNPAKWNEDKYNNE